MRMKKNLIVLNLRLVLCLLLLMMGSSVTLAQTARWYDLFSLADGATNDATTSLPSGTTNTVFLQAGAVTIMPGATNAIAITSSNIVVHCEEFNDVGFTYSGTAMTGSGTNGLSGVQIYASMSKGYVIDQVPRWSFVQTNYSVTGGLTFETQVDLSISGCDRLYFTFLNQSGGVISNVVASLEFKAPKYGMKTSTQ